MQTSSSAYRTCSESRSASECTATVFKPISLQARMIRRAISPRLAMRTLENIGLEAYGEQLLSVLHRLAVLGEDLHDFAVHVRLDLVHQLHRLDNAKDLAFAHLVADGDERLRLGIRRAIKRPDDRRGDHIQSRFGFLGFLALRREL